MSPRTSLSAAGDVWPALWETFVETRHLHLHLLRRDHVSPGQHLALRWIREADGVRLSALADALGISRPAVTSLVTSLESRGWARRQHTTTDRRGVVVRITPKAERLLREFDRDVAAVVRESTDLLPPEMRARTVEGLKALSAGIRAQRARYGLPCQGQAR